MLKTDPTEATIALIGTTGTGKSTFIHLLTGDDRIRIGHDLESQTSEVNFANYVTEHGQHVRLVDTPGFDDSHKGVTDTDILERISKFLLSDGGQKLNGLIYMHRISDPRMDYTAKKSLEIFSELCGEQNFANVGIVTIDWDGVNENEGETREQALSKKYFRNLIDEGAKMFRHDGEFESAQLIVSDLIQQPPVTLKIQEELNAGRTLAETSAGAVIMREMKEMQKEHELRVQALKDEMEQESRDMRDQLEAERQELVKRMAQVQEDSKRLEETRMARGLHNADLGPENVNETIPGQRTLRSRDGHPQGRERPHNPFSWEHLHALVTELGFLAKRHLKVGGVLLSFGVLFFFLNSGDIYGVYRSWLYGTSQPLALDRPGGGVWPNPMLSTGVSRDKQAAPLGPVGDTSTERQSEYPYGSTPYGSGGLPVYRNGMLPDSRRSTGVGREYGRTGIKWSTSEGPYRRQGRIIVSKPIGDTFSDESPHTAVFHEEEDGDEDKLPGFLSFYFF